MIRTVLATASSGPRRRIMIIDRAVHFTLGYFVMFGGLTLVLPMLIGDLIIPGLA